MLGSSPFYANIPVSDIARARAFYEGVLGLHPWRIDDRIHEVIYEAGMTRFAVYQSAGAGKSEHTIGTFVIEDLDAVVASLRSKGVNLVDYDLPGLKTEDGVATFGFDRVAWFRDPDENLINLTQEGPGGRTSADA